MMVMDNCFTIVVVIVIIIVVVVDDGDNCRESEKNK